MSAEVQLELTKRIIRDWVRSNDCSGVDALVAITEILDFDPYTWKPSVGRGTVPDVAHGASGGD